MAILNWMVRATHTHIAFKLEEFIEQTEKNPNKPLQKKGHAIKSSINNL